MTGSYDQPDKGSGFAPSEHPDWVGQLFLFWPESVENVVFVRADGQPDPTDIVTADVAIITLPDEKTGAPTFLKGARIGGAALAPQLKKKVGRKVLGKLTQLPKQPGKNAAYHLEVPDANSPEWAQMCQLAEQYEQQHPHASDSYNQPSTNGSTPSWQQTSAPAPTAPPAASWQQQQMPSTGNGTPAPAPAPSAAPVWGATAPAPAPAAPPWPAGLREFLTERGYDTAQMDEQTARQIAATL